MLEFLPINIKKALEYLNLHYVYELRLRANQPITINYKGNYCYLGAYGITDIAEKALRCSSSDIGDCVYRAGEYSVYAVEEQIKQGFVTAKHGERLGIAGEYVFENGKVHALRNFSSVCVRVPHEIIGSGEEIYKCCMSDRVKNVLIMSPPGLGKTTILRDLSRILAEKTRKNILICDERGEIGAGDVGASCDIIKYCDKLTAFSAGIRALRPEIMITDELSEIDCIPIKRAVDAGIKVIASAHFADISYVKPCFGDIFDYFVQLDSSETGKLRAIYARKDVFR